MQPNVLASAELFGGMPGGRASNIVGRGQYGIGVNLPAIDSSTPLVLPPSVLKVVSTPAMFDGMPEYVNTLVELMESHTRQVTGVDFGYNVNTEQVPFGFDGQQFKSPVKTVRTDVNPSLQMIELPGMLCYNVFREWMFGINHPDSNASQVGWNQPLPFVISTYAASFLMIQYDMTFLPENIVDAAFYYNVFPTSIGDVGFEKNIATGRTLTRTIQCSAMVIQNDAVRRMATKVVTDMAIHRLDYYNLAPIQTIINSNIAEAGIPQDANNVNDEIIAAQD